MLRRAKGGTGRSASRRSVRFDGADEAALAEQIDAWVSMDRRRLGEVLLDLGAIHPDDLIDALSRQRERVAAEGGDVDRVIASDPNAPAGDATARLGRLLVEQNIITEVDLAAALAEQFGVPLADLRQQAPDQEAIDRIPEELARRHGVIPLRVEDDRVYLAAADPLDVDAINDLTHATGRIGLLIGAQDDISRLIDRSYDALAAAQVHIQAFELIEGGPVEDTSTMGVDENAPVVQIVNRLVWQGVRSRASDIHIEPLENSLRVRYRVDGALSEAITLPAQMANPIASRIKVMAELNIVERRRPQDGQFQVSVDGRPIDVRASIVGTIHGEKVVLRLLDTTRSLIGLGDLGMTPDVVEPYLAVAKAPLGMVLCTGPTGSGKTTTLYATLAEINDATRNVVTIEDPVEYHFAGVNQMQVSRAGISFADGLRGILRQDPDIILVGEIRDEDTARIAMQASLTGHLVLSSLHAVDAAAAVHRFTDMGIEPFLVASSLNAVIGQRLLRRICTACRVDYTPTPAEVAVLEQHVGRLPERFTRGEGCNICSGTGYRGRIGVYELLEITDAIRELIVTKATHSQIHRVAVAQGMRPMQTQALELVVDGVTTVQDVLRNVYAPAMGQETSAAAPGSLAAAAAASAPEGEVVDLTAVAAPDPADGPTGDVPPAPRVGGLRG